MDGLARILASMIHDLPADDEQAKALVQAALARLLGQENANPAE